MKRLGEMDVAESVEARVISGPADLLTWEVSASMNTDGIPLEVIGRGSDLEAAAACAMVVLAENGSTLHATSDEQATMPVDGEAPRQTPSGPASKA